ncbi:MAG: L-threonylcarbamoyladenylate synthase [Lautropia sp.]|nr:L-threonylcarbamoyladenylate synthase [Lautropia sp.]
MQDDRMPASGADLADALHEAVRILREGGVIGLPTETVYGLAADAAQADAVASIYRIKGRPADHPLIVHVADIASARQWADWTPEAQRLADAFWPGPLTLVLPRRAGAPDFACGGQSTIGLRSPSHPVFRRLMTLLAPHGITGLAAPSANRFGRISPSRAAHVRADLGDAVPLVLEGGPAEVGLESTIVDLSRGRAVILRPGHIGQAELAQALGEPVLLGYQVRTPDSALPAGGKGEGQSQLPDAPRVPGALASHYAPSAPLRVLIWPALVAALHAAREAGEAVAVWSEHAPEPQPGLFWRRRPADAAGAGHDLYDALHQLDALPVARILVQALPEGTAWQALADRLGRAAAAG